MSLKGIDDYHGLSEQIKLTKIPNESQEPVRTLSDIIEELPEVKMLNAKASRWKRLFVALAVVFAVAVGGLGFACSQFYTSQDSLASEWEDGYAQGKADGYTVGYDEGFAAGASQSFAIQQEAVQAEDPTPAESEPEPEVSTGSSGSDEVIVYVTDTGTKYHQSWCSSLWNSSHEKTLSQAIAAGYAPCKNCDPPS